MLSPEPATAIRWRRTALALNIASVVALLAGMLAVIVALGQWATSVDPVPALVVAAVGGGTSWPLATLAGSATRRAARARYDAWLADPEPEPIDKLHQAMDDAVAVHIAARHPGRPCREDRAPGSETYGHCITTGDEEAPDAGR